MKWWGVLTVILGFVHFGECSVPSTSQSVPSTGQLSSIIIVDPNTEIDNVSFHDVNNFQVNALFCSVIIKVLEVPPPDPPSTKPFVQVSGKDFNESIHVSKCNDYVPIKAIKPFKNGLSTVISAENLEAFRSLILLCKEQGLVKEKAGECKDYLNRLLADDVEPGNFSLLIGKTMKECDENSIICDVAINITMVQVLELSIFFLNTDLPDLIQEITKLFVDAKNKIKFLDFLTVLMAWGRRNRKINYKLVGVAFLYDVFGDVLDENKVTESAKLPKGEYERIDIIFDTIAFTNANRFLTDLTPDKRRAFVDDLSVKSGGYYYIADKDIREQFIKSIKQDELNKPQVAKAAKIFLKAAKRDTPDGKSSSTSSLQDQDTQIQPNPLGLHFSTGIKLLKKCDEEKMFNHQDVARLLLQTREYGDHVFNLAKYVKNDFLIPGEHTFFGSKVREVRQELLTYLIVDFNWNLINDTRKLVYKKLVTFLKRLHLYYVDHFMNKGHFISLFTEIPKRITVS